MSLLLDTHVLIWLLNEDERVPDKTIKQIEQADTIFISAVSIWKICNKYHVGKLQFVQDIVHRLEEIVAEKNFTGLPISLSHASKAALLSNHHRDPWDRILIAQALAENLTIVSNETLFDQYKVTRLW